MRLGRGHSLVCVVATALSVNACGTPSKVQKAADLVVSHGTTYKASLESMVKQIDEHRTRQAARIARMRAHTDVVTARTQTIVLAWKLRKDKRAGDMLKAVREDKGPPQSPSDLALGLQNRFGRSTVSTVEWAIAMKNIREGTKAASFSKVLQNLTPFLSSFGMILDEKNFDAKANMNAAAKAAKGAGADPAPK